jgi:hypothetical protein
MKIDRISSSAPRLAAVFAAWRKAIEESEAARAASAAVARTPVEPPPGLIAKSSGQFDGLARRIDRSTLTLAAMAPRDVGDAAIARLAGAGGDPQVAGAGPAGGRANPSRPNASRATSLVRPRRSRTGSAPRLPAVESDSVVETEESVLDRLVHHAQDLGAERRHLLTDIDRYLRHENVTKAQLEAKYPGLLDGLGDDAGHERLSLLGQALQRAEAARPRR